ncbi:MAG: CHRD domain-containing protein [Arcicella sp.]|nr:CHRD domain-containing protein [Arcicella sp.]
MRKIQLFALFIALGLASACKSEEVNPEQNVTSTLAPSADLLLASATLAGANEVPAVTTTATGTATGSYNKTSKILNLNVTYAGMTPTAWHIHNAASGVNGAVIFNLINSSNTTIASKFPTPFNYSTPLALAADQETNLLAGNNYVNIHSAKNPGGEIRGQLALKASTAQGTVTGKFNNSTKILTLQVTYTGLTPTMWHIHKGAVGVAGPVVLDLGTTFTSPFNFSTSALTAEQEADLKAGLFYVNIHTIAVPSGEIRGQLTVK